MIEYWEVKTKQLEPIVVELLCIIRDGFLRYPNLAYDIFLDKIIGISFSDFGERFSLYPLGEIIYGDQQNFFL